MMNQLVFKRHEIKFLISRRQRELIEHTLSRYMQPDQYGRSTICNIYFDTPDRRLIRRSLEKPVYKEKLRMRSYGLAAHGSPVFVELKKKYKGIVYKRRVSLPVDTAESYLLQQAAAPADSQIMREISYFVTIYPQIEPSMFIAYDRTAFYGQEGIQLRITFDEQILWRDRDLSLTKGIYGQSLLAHDQVLMEVKTASALPLWLTRLLTENKIYQTSISKYGTAYQAAANQGFRRSISA